MYTYGDKELARAVDVMMVRAKGICIFIIKVKVIPQKLMLSINFFLNFP